ncbi:hypothetical protein GGR57DRAFT_461925 [Xylariaceae sp. FL1272]|nr:hypothetical protein GGR57DRAFT_461925 [Xylariaceae sp. FL1272]
MASKGHPLPKLQFKLQPRSCMPMPFIYPNLIVEADYAEGSSPFPHSGRGALRLQVVRQSDGKQCVAEDRVYPIINGAIFTGEKSTKFYAVFRGPVFDSEQGKDWSLPKETREVKLEKAEKLIRFLESGPKDVKYRFRVEYFGSGDSRPATAIDSKPFTWMGCDGLTETHKQLAKDGKEGQKWSQYPSSPCATYYDRFANI